ncbi:MAG TPA: nuclear transport factor 2 family protein [Pyrinomonadaceae bacterium]|nr:nuclear transport factor 2 family protein [Pyrinomonadaceae bacterium]
MKRNVVSAALVFSLGLIALGIAACQPAPDANVNATATASPTPEKVDAAAIEAEVMKLAREWISAAQTRNPEAVRRVVADDAILHYPDGTTATKADELRLIETGAITADSWDLLDHKVTVLNADTAIITGRSGLKNGKYKDQNMPKPIDISGEYRFLDVYARRNGRWQVVASQATKLATP